MDAPIHLLKRLLPRGLMGRSLMIIVTPLVVVQLVTIYVFFTSHWETVARRLANGVAGDIAMAVEDLRTVPDPSIRAARLMAIQGLQEMEIRYFDGGILLGSRFHRPATTMERALLAALNERVKRPCQIEPEPERRRILIRVQLTEGVLEASVSKKRLVSYTTTVFLLWTAGTALLLLGVATLFMRNQVRSVRRLAKAADRFGRGLDVSNFKPEGASEVRQAAMAFDLMRGRIQRQIQQRTEMLAGVSHDLRTPLTRMTLQLALMEGIEGTAELSEDVAEMGRMVEGYLAFARGEGTEKPQPGDLSALLEEVAARSLREGKLVDVHSEGPVPMIFRPDALSRALANLIGNATRFGKTVRVRVGNRFGAADVPGAEVVIDDDGPGIPPERRDDVFKPFTRLESSRNPRTGGVGLGLTIARDIVRGHGGDVTLEDSPLGGLRVRLWLPF